MQMSDLIEWTAIGGEFFCNTQGRYFFMRLKLGEFVCERVIDPMDASLVNGFDIVGHEFERSARMLHRKAIEGGQRLPPLWVRGTVYRVPPLQNVAKTLANAPSLDDALRHDPNAWKVLRRDLQQMVEQEAGTVPAPATDQTDVEKP